MFSFYFVLIYSITISNCLLFLNNNKFYENTIELNQTLIEINNNVQSWSFLNDNLIVNSNGICNNNLCYITLRNNNYYLKLTDNTTNNVLVNIGNKNNYPNIIKNCNGTLVYNLTINNQYKLLIYYKDIIKDSFINQIKFNLSLYTFDYFVNIGQTNVCEYINNNSSYINSTISIVNTNLENTINNSTVLYSNSIINETTNILISIYTSLSSSSLLPSSLLIKPSINYNEPLYINLSENTIIKINGILNATSMFNSTISITITEDQIIDGNQITLLEYSSITDKFDLVNFEFDIDDPCKEVLPELEYQETKLIMNLKVNDKCNLNNSYILNMLNLFFNLLL